MVELSLKETLEYCQIRWFLLLKTSYLLSMNIQLGRILHQKLQSMNMHPDLLNLHKFDSTPIFLIHQFLSAKHHRYQRDELLCFLILQYQLGRILHLMLELKNANVQIVVIHMVLVLDIFDTTPFHQTSWF